MAAGRVGDKQLAALEQVLAHLAGSGLARVVLIHHPPLPDLAPKSRALTDADLLQAVFNRAGAELVLHGHNHRDMLNWADGPRGKFPVLGIASGSAARAHKNEALGRYNLVRIRKSGEDWMIEVTGRGIPAPNREVTELDRQALSLSPG